MAFIRGSGQPNLLLNTYLLGVCQAFLISGPRDPIIGLVGKSVLLPVSYRIPEPPPTLRITWVHQNSIILFSEMAKCPAGPAVAPVPPRICHKYNIVVGEYKQRVTFYPENGSLLLRDLRVSDDGRYSVTFAELNQTRHLSLFVLQMDPSSPDPTLDPGEDEEPGPYFLQPLGVRLGGLAVFFLVILGLHLQRWRKV